MLKKEQKGQIGIDFLMLMFVILLGFYVFLIMWGSIDTLVIDAINNLEGDLDSAIVALIVLVPLAIVVNVLRVALKGKSEGEIPRQATGQF